MAVPAVMMPDAAVKNLLRHAVREKPTVAVSVRKNVNVEETGTMNAMAVRAAMSHVLNLVSSQGRSPIQDADAAISNCRQCRLVCIALAVSCPFFSVDERKGQC